MEMSLQNGNLKTEHKGVMTRIEGLLARKKKTAGLGLQLDALGWVIVVLIIAAVAIGAIFYLRDSARVATTKMELDQIRQAILQYEGQRIDSSQLEENGGLELLLTRNCIPASESIDGISHGPFLPFTNRWVEGAVPLDLWGNPYQLGTDAAGNRVLRSTGGGDKDITVEIPDDVNNN